MLPINNTATINGLKYKIESLHTGYLINDEFIIFKNESGQWDCADKIDWQLLRALGEKVEDLIWFKANGI